MTVEKLVVKMDKQQKLEKIIEMYIKIDDPLFKKFFDLDSEEMLDEKIAVMETLVEGQTPNEIKNYYAILELMPKDDNSRWDL